MATPGATRYDAIVIGSGMGGLAFAAVMARMAGWRVAVLERHFRAGGFTHTFRRPGGWEWDVGVHYVGDMAPGSQMRKVFDFVTGNRVKWNPMPDDYDHFEYPGLRFAASKGAKVFERNLEAAFPEERRNIRGYFRDVKQAAAWSVRPLMAKVMPPALGAGIGWWTRLTSKKPLMTTGEYLESRFRDPKLRALVASQWGDYGLAPGRSAFAVHALIAAHYFGGAWFPEGGAGRIAEGAGHVIGEHGGEILVNHEVTRIVLENGAAVGVEAIRRVGKQGEAVEMRAPVVVSDAGAWTTYRRLLPEGEWTPPATELDAAVSSSTSMAALYVGLKRDPRELGFRGENYWLFDGFDHDRISAQADELMQGQAHMCYLSFPSLKNPVAVRHTAEILAPISWEALGRHQGEPWRRRGEEYRQAKERISTALIRFVEERHRGFRDAIEYQELSTPLTVEHFTGHPHGAIYGYPATPARFGLGWLGPKTGIRGLYLAGADAGSLGIVGALMGGVMAAALNLGPLGFLRVMAAAARARKETPKKAVTASAFAS